VSDLTILVNTSDSFEDCWKPFFTLLSKYWPDCPHPVVLNTEHKNFHWPGLDLRAARVATGETNRLTWSECLARCLDTIDTPYVLYLQEDYFLEDYVKFDQLERMLDYLRRGEANVIRIHECEGSGPWHPQPNGDLWEVDRRSRYLIGLQAGLWRKSALRNCLRDHESPWQLEILGTRRARRHLHKVFCVNRERYSGPGKEIIPYVATGVVAGRWAHDIVVPLFKRHGIEIDFSGRGFYVRGTPRKKAPVWRRALDHLRSAF
jgi:hypothetical protein